MADNRDARMLRMSEEFQRMVADYFRVQCRYEAGIQVVQTKLEVLDREFRLQFSRDPIHQMQSRMKSLDSVMEKLARKQKPISIASAEENLTDIAGIRVICSYISDIYMISDLLCKQDDVRVIRVRDYIKAPKPNGYRSLHLVVEVPVNMSAGKELVPVEVQIRTIAMDYWATLEHHLCYKCPTAVPPDISSELTAAAERIAALDHQMQGLYDRIEVLEAEHEAEDQNDYYRLKSLHDMNRRSRNPAAEP